MIWLLLACRGLSVNDVTTGESEAYPELKSLYPTEPPSVAFARVVAVAESMEGWENCEHSAPRELHCEAVTPLFGFVDDLWVRVEPYGLGASKVSMRSASRTGKGDLGANARRIEAFQAAYLAFTPGSPENANVVDP